jgi:hypothetical protein
MVPLNATLRTHPAKATRNERRGVLLLVVLSMLTLFVLLGSTYLVASMRARRVAQAFADRVTAPAAAGPTGGRLVDQAMLTFLRGTNATAAPVALRQGDDLLGDMYGNVPPVTGELVAVADYAASAGFIELEVASATPSPANPSELTGRIVTLKLPGLTASTRVLRATSGANLDLVIAAGPPVVGPPLLRSAIAAALLRATSPVERRVIVNSREFADSGTNEPWDAFDNDNPLLTRILPWPTPGTRAVTLAPVSVADFNNNPALRVDNDGDGIPDSVFLDVGLPPFRNVDGVEVQPRAAVLVVDLDGRVNLNVHGDLATIDAFDPSLPGTVTEAIGGDSLYPRYYISSQNPPYTWTNGPNAAPLRALSPGLGQTIATSLAKADVFRSTGQFSLAGALTLADALRAAGRTEAGSQRPPGQGQTSDAQATHRYIPNIGDFEGRYGGLPPTDILNPATRPQPGRPNFNDPITETRERWTVELQTIGGQELARNYFVHPGRYGTPPDLKGRMSVWADPQTGQPLFYKPFWDQASRGRLSDNEVVDDPYEIDLTPRGARIAASRNPGTGGVDINNPYTTNDLEGLLRFFDPDSPRLSRRLVAVNDAVASVNRLSVTTDSWDTTAVTGVAWEEVVQQQFDSLLNASTVNDYFAPETIMGHRLDVNRPFHLTDVTEPYFDDQNGNGIYDPGELRTGEQKRQEFAKHLYCLLVGISARNGLAMPMTPDDARRLAQYAVNIVDFRDADSIMTLFRYDPAFRPGSTSWNPTDVVWGCERPEVLITETYAWHDRNTDDEAVGGSVRALGEDLTFDQQRRPRGAFFVELTSPWGAPVYEYDQANQNIRPLASPPGSSNPFNHFRADILDSSLVSQEDRNNDGVLDPGEDRNGNGVLDGPDRNRLRTGIDLEKRVGGAGSPVWRLASVRGNVTAGTAFGTDALSDAMAHTGDSVLDPAAPGSTATIDRVFYFCTTQPPAANMGEVPGGVFWQSRPSPTPLTRGHYRVIGTDAPFNPGVGAASSSVAVMIGPGDKPATMSEPLIDSNDDPYDVIMQRIGTNPMTPSTLIPSIADSWATPIDDPLDSYGPPTRPFPPGANVVSEAFVTSANDPVLMINGLHENFAMIHLQRLANPSKAWNTNPADPDFNPYISVDCMPVDLNVVNTVNAKAANTPSPMTALLPQGNYDDPSAAAAKAYGRTSDPLLSVERSGRPGPPAEPDGWNRHVRNFVAPAGVRDAHAFRSADVMAATATDMTLDPVVDRRPIGPSHTLDGQITGFRITDQGSGYDPESPPNITVSGGTGADFEAIVDDGRLVAINVRNGGSGFSDPASITVTIDGLATADPIIGGRPTRWSSNDTTAAMFWPNRPFENLIELSLVPVTSPFHLTQRHSIDSSSVPPDQKFLHLPGYWEDPIPTTPWAWRYVTGRIAPPPPSGVVSFFDFLHIRSRFAGLNLTVPTAPPNITALAQLGLDRYPSEQLSTWREPGRININTIVDGRGPNGEPRGAWRALFGGLDADEDASMPNMGVGARLPRWAPDVFGPPETPEEDEQRPPPASGAPQQDPISNGASSFAEIFNALPDPVPNQDPDPPARGTRQGGMIDSHTNAMTDRHRQTDRHAYFRYQTMLNLSERVTTRSNVYAIWVTIGYFEPGTTNEIQPVQRNRGFYIVDRSIPVAYERGQDHNVRDAVRLRRIIQ